MNAYQCQPRIGHSMSLAKLALAWWLFKMKKYTKVSKSLITGLGVLCVIYIICNDFNITLVLLIVRDALGDFEWGKVNRQNICSNVSYLRSNCSYAYMLLHKSSLKVMVSHSIFVMLSSQYIVLFCNNLMFSLSTGGIECTSQVDDRVYRWFSSFCCEHTMGRR